MRDISLLGTRKIFQLSEGIFIGLVKDRGIYKTVFDFYNNLQLSIPNP